jgi:NAD(P)-dependent dehydrogenase (short-subunit alcohol dehydrogenase family)
MDLKLTNKLALVTGSTSGIGFAIAAQLAAEGARVIINGRTSERVADAVARLHKINPEYKLEAAAGDLSLASDTDELIARFPSVDILVNNLGIFEVKEFIDITDDEWRRFFDVNVLSGIRLSRAYLPGMLRLNSGRIVFISSESGLQIPVEMIHYGMTKTAQISVARGLAELTAGTLR